MDCKAAASTHGRFLPWHADLLLCLQEECQLCIFSALQEFTIQEISKQGFLIQWLHCGLDHPNSTLAVTLDSSLSTCSSQVQLRLCPNYIFSFRLLFPLSLVPSQQINTLCMSAKKRQWEITRVLTRTVAPGYKVVAHTAPRLSSAWWHRVLIAPLQPSRNPFWESNYLTGRKADARAVNNKKVLQDGIQEREDACEWGKGYGSPGAPVMRSAMNWVSTETPS